MHGLMSITSDTDHLTDVTAAINDVKIKWREIGLFLGISHMRLEVLEQEEDDLDDKLNGMVEHWLKERYSVENFGRPSWKALVEAIAARAGGDNRSFASEIAEKHSGVGMFFSTSYELVI